MSTGTGQSGTEELARSRFVHHGRSDQTLLCQTRQANARLNDKPAGYDLQQKRENGAAAMLPPQLDPRNPDFGAY